MMTKTDVWVGPVQPLHQVAAVQAQQHLPPAQLLVLLRRRRMQATMDKQLPQQLLRVSAPLHVVFFARKHFDAPQAPEAHARPHI